MSPTFVPDSTSNCVFWKNADNTFQDANSLFLNQLNFDSIDDLVGQTDYDLCWSEKHREKYLKDDKYIIDTQKPLLNFEEEQRQPDGSIKTLLVSKFPWVADDKKIVLGVVGMYSDITERKLMEKILLTSDSFRDAIVKPHNLNFTLPPKQLEVLELYNQGLPRKLAADRLGISETTYAWYLRQIREKFNIRTRQEMLLLEQEILRSELM